MAQESVSKAALLDGLKNTRDRLVDALSGIPESRFEGGCYENGWNARQVLAHVAGIEWSYPRLIGIAEGKESPKRTSQDAPTKPDRAAQGGINSYNDRTVERYASTSVGELLDIFKENRDKTIAAVEATAEEVFSVPVRSAGGIPGPLGTVLNYVAVVHVAGHVNDIVSAAGE